MHLLASNLKPWWFYLCKKKPLRADPWSVFSAPSHHPLAVPIQVPVPPLHCSQSSRSRWPPPLPLSCLFPFLSPEGSGWHRFAFTFHLRPQSRGELSASSATAFPSAQGAGITEEGRPDPSGRC